MEFRYKYGVLGAGAVSRSLIGRIPFAARDFGPVSAVSYRVASRIANTLRAGHPVRTAEEFNNAAVVLFHAPPEQAENLLQFLEKSPIRWAGKALVFCDCEDRRDFRDRLEARGASTALARDFGIPGLLLVSGTGPALAAAHRIARGLKLKPVEILPCAMDVFDAAVTLGTAAITPLIDCGASLLRQAGVRDTDAARIAAALFIETARNYAHSGKQSWAWYIRSPNVARILRQLAAVDSRSVEVSHRLLLFGLELFGKCPELEAALAPALPKK